MAGKSSVGYGAHAVISRNRSNCASLHCGAWQFGHTGRDAASGAGTPFRLVIPVERPNRNRLGSTPGFLINGE
jgi:hypothetical protein